MERGSCNDTLDRELARHIKDNIKVPDGEEDDEPCWMLETNGKFSVKSAWEFLRHRESKQTSYRFIWEKGLPIKISFFMWRVWKGRISTDDILKRMMINIPSRCWCCEEHKEETVVHLFLTSSIAVKLWKFFASCAGIPTDGVGLHQMIMAWWTAETKPKLQPIYRAMPAVIMCTLVDTKPKVYYAKVLWRMPPLGRLKCNTDGACRGNHGISSFRFCIIDSNGDLVYAEAQQMGIATNMEAENLRDHKNGTEVLKEHNIQQLLIGDRFTCPSKYLTRYMDHSMEPRNRIEEIKRT
ncbi:uncharacterized protein LOC132039479 [Lycium ferocissimum]|uniref:uncharacterized protein LOC132039479 n=1 Tax=Lycium ferocissimum TaxID=112874 RepID=UPI0028151F16|nr:uncharacterized protein LOC132039479 [Lycium ferocissimum]